MYHLFNNYGGKDMMYRTELLEEITIENATVKINAKIEEMEKESYRLVTMSFWGTERAVLVFKKGLKGSLIEYICSYMQQSIFGTISWDYSKKMFNINGRINLFHSVLWGLLGLLFYYMILPMINLIKIKDKKVKLMLVVITCIFVVDCTLSALACYRQKERRENLMPSNKIEILLDKHYPDEYLNRIYNNAKVVKIK